MSNIEQGILNTERMFTFEELAQWTSKVWKNLEHPTQLVPILGISHDTRTLKPGDVYIAIKGAVHDGHDFIQQAVEKGAVGLIVDRELPMFGKIPQLMVPDTTAALRALAAGVRSTWTGTVIGITGSVGKTTVKELIASVLAQKGTVAKTPGNWNNDIGLPLSMLAADRNADFFVFELGMNHPGEIELLSALLKPDWAVLTDIGKAHIEFFQTLEPAEPGLDESFQTLEKIADEKAAILNHASCALLDADSDWFERLKAGFKGDVVTLTEEKFIAPQPGAHMVQNTRFAATLGLELGLPPEEIQKGLDAFEPAPMRWQIIKNDEGVFNGVVFINDAYNANPLSMRAALKTFAEMPCEGRRFAVLGGMRELGEDSETEHRTLSEFADSLGFDFVIRVGDQWGDGIKKSTACALLREKLRAGDRVLLKASRGERLETILDELKKEEITKS